MSTESGAPENAILTIGKHVMYERSEQRLRCAHDVMRIAPLTTLEAKVLQLLTASPHVIVMRSIALAMCEREGEENLGEDAPDTTVRRLIHAFGRADPSQAYIRIMPRLGYVLIQNVRVAG